MYTRVLNLSNNNSFFLFGARATGKSTLLGEFIAKKKALIIDLLDPSLEQELGVHPSRLIDKIEALDQLPEWIFIDEIQKIPKLLDVVHKIIFEKKIKFALTGSSARKLKRGNANLLAGRAFSFKLHPLTFIELKNDFKLDAVLNFGTLPEIFHLKSDLDKRRYLQSYVQNYVKEEVLIEQLIRNIEPFRAFLEVAAQMNAEIVNYSNLAKEASIDPKSVERYYSILEDTLLGFFLHSYSKSVRKRQVKAPKFYFFDIGVVRALSGQLHSKPVPHTYSYGKYFEQLVILEIIRLNDYFEKDFKFSYFRSGAGVEIDLVIEKPDKEVLLVEIKSTDKVIDSDLSALISIGKEIKGAKKIVLCNEKTARKTKDVLISPWREGIIKIFR